LTVQVLNKIYVVVQSVLCSHIYNGYKTVITTQIAVSAAKVYPMFRVGNVLDYSATVCVSEVPSVHSFMIVYVNVIC